MRNLIVFLLFLLLSLAWTRPLALRLTEAFPGNAGDHDVVTFIWNLWWVRHAVMELHTSPLTTELVFAPFTIDLRVHTLGLLHGLVSIPLQPFFGVIGSFNIILWLTMTLNGFTAYLLARRFWSSDELARIAGALVAINPALTFFIATGRPSFASIWPLAVATLLLDQLIERCRARDAIGLGLVAVAALLLDLQIFLFLALWIGFYLLAQRSRTIFTPGFLWRAGLAGLIPAVPLFFIFFGALQGAAAPSLEDSLRYSIRFRDFFHPATVRFLMGWATPLLTVAALFMARRGPWLFIGFGFLVLSLGATLQPTALPLPFAALRELPGLAQFRTPYRFTAPAALALALAGVTAIDSLRKRWPQKSRSGLQGVLLLVLVDGFTAEPQHHPFEIQSYPPERIYQRIADEPGEFTVLQVPLGVRSGVDAFGSEETLQFYQMTHAKRAINGMVARVPKQFFDFYRASPAFRLLAGEPVEDDELVLADLTYQLRGMKVGYIVLHLEKVAPERLEQIVELLEQIPDIELVEATSSIKAYRQSLR